MRVAASAAVAAALLAGWLGAASPALAGDAPRVVGHVGETPRLAAIVPAARPLVAPPPEQVALGRRLFLDTRLSRPAGTSCASCHDPAQAFSAFNGGPGQAGV
ncbi:MAG: cytochrome B6, partial [Variovorax sp.]